MRERFIYFIKPAGMDGPIKIGISTSPHMRLDGLMAWSPFPLDVIGSVKGTHADEIFLHSCFVAAHSHREWFHSSPELRSAIADVLEAGSVSVLHGKITPKKVGAFRRRIRSDDEKLRTSLLMRVSWTERKQRAIPGNERCYVPADVLGPLRRWSGDYKGSGPRPTDEEFARVHQYLADPATHSVFASWRKVAA